MAEEKIEILLAEKGKKFEEDGQAIASYGKSIVFLPKGAEPGKKVRVKLVEVREDSRGRMMYRGEPAPDEYTEKWKDNGDGDGTRVTIATNWLLVESEVGVIETRKLENREGSPSWKSKKTLKWGSDLTFSFIEEVKVKIVPLEKEEVQEGKMQWVKKGEREEVSSPIARRIESLTQEQQSGSLWRERLQNSYGADLEASFAITYRTDFNMWSGSKDEYVQKDHFTVKWQDLPQWWKSDFEAQFPTCSCGRQRRETQADGYGKCEKCRSEETCERCGKQTKISVVNGKFVCDACKPQEQQEHWISQYLPPAYLEQIADEAKSLLSGQALQGELGELVLKVGLNNVLFEHSRLDLENQWKGYQWYYFTDNGVYGTKFAPAALQVIQFLPKASGNAFVELVAWILDGPRPSSDDFYLKQQVQGDINVKPSITEDQLQGLKSKLEAVESVLAVWLRGSEADRITLVAGCQRIEEKFGKESSQFAKVTAALQNKEQNYAAGLKALWEVEELFAAVDRGEVLINFAGHFRHMGQNDQSDIWVIGPDGEQVEPQTDYRKRYTSEGDKLWEVVGPEDLALCWCRGQANRWLYESWEVVKLPVGGLTKEQESAALALEPHERFRGRGTGWDLTRVGLVEVSVPREEREVPTRYFRSADGSEKTEPIWCEVFGWDAVSSEEEEEGWALPESNPEILEARKRLRVVRAQLEKLDQERQYFSEGSSARVEITFEKDPVRDTLFAFANLNEVPVEDVKRQEFTTLSGKVRCVCDPSRCYWLEEKRPAAGETWICTISKIIGRDNKSRPVIVVNPQAQIDPKAEEAILSEIEGLEDKIAGLAKNPDETPLPEGPEVEASNIDAKLQALKTKWVAH